MVRESASALLGRAKARRVVKSQRQASAVSGHGGIEKAISVGVINRRRKCSVGNMWRKRRRKSKWLSAVWHHHLENGVRKIEQRQAARGEQQ